jgi:hypothetical protein
VPLNRVYTVLTQASTGPPRRGESNEMEHIVASGACLIIVSPQAWQARAHDFPFPSAASLTLLSSHSGWPEQAGADFLILLGVESHIVQRWAANLATTLTLAVRIAEQGTL